MAAAVAISACSLALTIYDKVREYKKDSGRSTGVWVNVEQLQTWLTEMQSSLMDAENRIDQGPQRLRQYVINVGHLACEIEDALLEYHRIAVGYHKTKHYLLGGNVVEEATKQLAAHISNICTRKASWDKLDTLLLRDSSAKRTTTTEDRLQENNPLARDDHVVGFEVGCEELLTQLMNRDTLSTILVAGPGGSGKSTLVEEIWRSESITNERGVDRVTCFDHPVWVHGPVITLRTELRRIFDGNDAVALMHGTGMNLIRGENETEQRLRLLLQRKRVVLVLENVVSKDDFDLKLITTVVRQLQELCPPSKIVIISRKSDITSDHNYIIDLSSGLSPDKAMVLFCKKLTFSDPPNILRKDLKASAIEILNMCDGMPLAISSIVPLLGKLGKQKQSEAGWKEVIDSHGEEICEAGAVLFLNLQPSYIDLPSDFRPCFLYLSMFPQDRSVSRKRLIRLWVAEGFVTPKGTREADHVAADILDQLVKRNLVVAGIVEVAGRLVRRYRLLFFVRQINILRAHNFLTILEPKRNLSADKIRRLSVDEGPLHLIQPRTAQIRTVLVFRLADDTSIVDLKKLLETSKFLRVLDLQGLAALEEFPDQVVGLYLLKYLNLRGTKIKTVPGSIKQLVDLETLDIRETNVTRLPSEINHLHHLRHLLMFFINGGVQQGVQLSSKSIRALCSIQTLSRVKVGNDRKILDALLALTGLRKLGLTHVEKKDGRKLCNCLEVMTVLSILDVRATSKHIELELDHVSPGRAPPLLQSLHLEGRLANVPNWITGLNSLTKVCLKWSKLPIAANPLESLQSLPCLMELELVDYCTRPNLEFVDGMFLRLEILRIEEFDQLTSVTIQHNALPQLKDLSMRQCPNLTVLPTGIDHLTMIKKFRSRNMDDQFVASLQAHYNNSRIELDLV